MRNRNSWIAVALGICGVLLALLGVNLLNEDQWLCTIEEAEAKNFQRALQ